MKMDEEGEEWSQACQRDMDADPEVDLAQVHVRAVSPETASLLAALLNPTKLFPSPPPLALSRDWRGLATLTSMPAELIPAAQTSSDPTGYVLTYWAKQSVETANIGLLLKYFEQIDRYDILDDTKILLETDAKMYQKKMDVKSLMTSRPVPKPGPSSDEALLTVHDAQLSELGVESPQYYDAFVLYADEDVDFAAELIERMEAFGFKLCVKDRDMLGGLTFEHTAMMTLISERCNRLIVIISPDFLQSPANTFFVNFAQALGIEQRRRKIVPCLYKSCVLPPQLSYYFLLNYERSGKLWNFWDKLKDSLKVTNAIPQNQRVTIREIDSNSESCTVYSSEVDRTPRKAICDVKYSQYEKPQPIMNGSIPNGSHPDEDKIVNEPNVQYPDKPKIDTPGSQDLSNSVDKPNKDKKWYKKIFNNVSDLKEDSAQNKKKKKWTFRKQIPLIAE